MKTTTTSFYPASNAKPRFILMRTGLFIYGVALLFYGMGGYLSFRSPSKVYFLNLFEAPQIFWPIPSLMIWNNHLPSLIHVIAFSFFTLAVLNATLSTVVYIPLLWAGINIFFEIGQHSIIKGLVSYFQKSHLLPHFIVNHSIRGTFDWIDIVYSLMGAGIAIVLFMLVGYPVENREERLHP